MLLLSMGKSVLITSYTNSAVDNIMLKLADMGAKMLRLGRAEGVHPDMHKFMLGSPAYPDRSATSLKRLMRDANLVTVLLSDRFTQHGHTSSLSWLNCELEKFCGPFCQELSTVYEILLSFKLASWSWAKSHLLDAEATILKQKIWACTLHSAENGKVLTSLQKPTEFWVSFVSPHLWSTIFYWSHRLCRWAVLPWVWIVPFWRTRSLTCA